VPKISALFWDVGGVLLTNGWDKPSRRLAVEKFGLDWEEFEDRHELVVTAFETGKMSLKEYLERTVFYRPRKFALDDFKDFLYSQSRPCQKVIAIVQRLAETKKYLLATLNNESLELNLYRIDQFGLRNYFNTFFSSCFLGVKKPDDAIYHLVLQITQRSPEECVLIDDRALNLECARNCAGMRTIHFRDAGQLERELQELGVEV
jgi:putative hydrolase of the HAD superfamily